MKRSKNDTNILELGPHPSHCSLLVDTHSPVRLHCPARPPSILTTAAISLLSTAPHSFKKLGTWVLLCPSPCQHTPWAHYTCGRVHMWTNHRILQCLGCVLNSLTPMSISPTVLQPHNSKATSWTSVIIWNYATTEILNSLNKTLSFQVPHALIPIYWSSSRSPRILNSLPFPCQSLLSPLSSIPWPQLVLRISFSSVSAKILLHQ